MDGRVLSPDDGVDIEVAIEIAVKGVVEAGLAIERVEIYPSGTIVIVIDHGIAANLKRYDSVVLPKHIPGVGDGDAA